jgi:hypothetical protein
MRVEDLSDVQYKFNEDYDAEIISCSVVVKTKSGDIHSYSIDQYGGFNQVYP